MTLLERAAREFCIRHGIENLTPSQQVEFFLNFEKKFREKLREEEKKENGYRN